jgi:hypothetical protein
MRADRLLQRHRRRATGADNGSQLAIVTVMRRMPGAARPVAFYRLAMR